MNSTAFTHVFRENFPLIFSFTRRIVDDASVAEEIVGDVFMKLWERFHNFDNIGAIKAFLYVVARNSSLNYLEEVKRRKKNENELSLLASAATEEAALHHIIRLEALQEVYGAIEELPAQIKKVIKFTLEGLKPQEIADKLGTSVNTVRNQKAKGLLLLKKGLSAKAFKMLVFILQHGTFL